MLFEKYGILGKNNKIDSYKYYFKMLLSKLDSLFEWENLPDTVDRCFLNTNLFLLGYSAFFKVGNNLYTNFGTFGGTPNENYYPTNFIIANPVLGSKEFKINSLNKDNCKIMYNTEADRQFVNFYGQGGLYRLLKQTATLLADNVQSINSAQINSRVQTIFRAADDTQRNTAEAVIKRMYNGDPYQILLSDELNPFDVLNLDAGTDKTITTLLEVHQYILADFYNQIGIPTTPYRKKERLITDEINTLDKINRCNIYTMLDARKKALDEINNIFSTDINIKIAAWLNEKQTAKTEQPENTEQPESTDENTGEISK